MKTVCVALVLVVAVAGCSYVGKVANVVSNEIDPAVLLQRYMWFKDAAAQLDKKAADIKVYEARLAALESQYAGVKRSAWPRDDRQEHAQILAELTGVKSSYNGLAAEYNAAMAKENWRFCEVGRLPQGASVPLPREFKPYQEK